MAGILEPTSEVRTETAFDGSHWQAACPDGWTFRRDKGVRGYPHVFETQAGARLQIGWGRDVWINFGRDLTRPGIESEPVRIAYVMSLNHAQMESANTIPRWLAATLRGMRAYDSRITRRDAGELIGFTYPTGDGWAGHFSREPWHLYITFSAPPERRDEVCETALAILGSIRFVKADVSG